jgi:chromosome partitioning protein
MGFIISIVNNKGGVGKSTVSANLADALGRLGKRVLFIDMIRNLTQPFF